MSHVIQITNSEESDNFIANNLRGVIFFGSVRCPHCRTMAPIYEQLANKYTSTNVVAFAHVETSEVEVDNLDGVPVFVAYKDHKPIDTVLGARPEALTTMIQQKLMV